MRFTAIIAATLAFASSAAAAECAAGATADCKPGFDYCASTLQDRGDADSAIKDAYRKAGYGTGTINFPGQWWGTLFHCNDDHTLTVVKSCGGVKCKDGGLNKNDYCASKSSGSIF
ncbi:hypothetical protein BO79DRAFT_270549 [Aspergillus costaricaensis CBS 115574]|uniref:Uncharacterized protein n=1 Tax=Aspergillus costaricaensis CBS 115574 TaxID=1448317 RepID=A0ACD1I7A5_9EURO|nr:hypothetical protein BO79DRAFT_270549 [Aspergillus costaricaensis CBS 115574]RAK86453.1 hypothetical protein BO79DRAFT_270549 [Aspergillus costaricaensis CBS 115574]